MKKIIFSGLLAAAIALSGFGCTNAPDDEVMVYMPDGAPALALAQLMAQDTQEDGVTYRVVDSSLIAAQVSYDDEDKNADLCVMPVNLAAKLLKTGERYVMLGAVTHGNLYLISKNETQYSRENLSALIGKTVGVLQINNVPGLTLKATLNSLQIPYAEIKNDGTMYEDKVNLIAISGADAVGTVEADCFLLAEPAVTAQAKKGYSIVGDVQALYGGENGYPQAVLVGKRAFVEENVDWTEDFTQKVKEAAAWLDTASGAEIVSAVTAHLADAASGTALKAPLLTADVLARCGVRYADAAECKTQTVQFLQDLLAVNPAATALPGEGFFWIK